MQNWAPGPYPDWYKSYLYYKEVAENYSTSWILKATETVEPWKLLNLFLSLQPQSFTMTHFQEAGFDRLSDFTISFHYVSANMM